MGRISEAIDDFNLVVEFFARWPGANLAFYNRALCLHSTGNLKDALSDCNAALNQNMDFTDARYLRATLFRELGNVEESLSDLDAVIDTDPDYAAAFFVRARIKYEQEQWTDAIRDVSYFVESSENKNSPNWKCYFIRGVSAFELGDNETAIKDLTIACELSPANSSVFLRRSAVYRAIGEMMKAKEDFDRGQALVSCPSTAD